MGPARGVLRADVARAASTLVELARDAGTPIMIASTVRTPEEQDRLCRKGYSRLCGRESAHVHGLAFDVALLDPATRRPEWPTDPAGIARWTRVGELGEELGLVWGGRWRPPDWPHFQARDAQGVVRRERGASSRRRTWPIWIGLAGLVWIASRRR